MKATVDQGTSPVGSFFKAAGGMETFGTAQVIDGVQFNAIGLESSKEMKHVAFEWQMKQPRFLTMIEKIEAQAEGKRDIMLPQSELRFDEKLALLNGSTFTNNGLRSVVTKLTGIPVSAASYLSDPYDRYGEPKSDEEYSSGLAYLAYCLNIELDRTNDKWESERTRKAEKEFLLRLRQNPYDPNLGEIVRMVASDRYGVVNNIDVMRWIQNSLPKDNIEQVLVSHMHSDFDNLSGNLLIPDSMLYVDDSDWGLGFAFSNSEDGTGKFYFCPFLFKAICRNGCIYNRRDASVAVDTKHLGDIDKKNLQEQILNLTLEGLTLGNKMLARMMDTKEAVIPVENASAVIALLSRTNGLQVKKGRAWWNGFLTEGGMQGGKLTNANTIINGLTRAAQSFEGQDRWQMETLAGDILTPALDAPRDVIVKNWDSTLNRAKHDISEKIAARYTTSVAVIDGED